MTIKVPSIEIPHSKSHKEEESVNIFSDVSDTEPQHKEVNLHQSKLEAPAISASQLMKKANMKRELERIEKKSKDIVPATIQDYHFGFKSTSLS